jgi:uncharacterized protein YbjT (DUF2867 family)
MKILIAGATGNTGLRLVSELASRGHHPVALVRESSDTGALPESTEKRRGDLTDLQDDVCDGCDAVVFAAGSGGDTDAEMTDKVDRDGAMRLIDIAAKAGVKRFVMLSSIGTENPPEDGEMAHYLQAKHEADEHLKASGLAYAIVRPIALTQADGNRDIRFGEDVDPQGKAARGDVAFVLADAVESADWLGKTAAMESV